MFVVCVQISYTARLGGFRDVALEDRDPSFTKLEGRPLAVNRLCRFCEGPTLEVTATVCVLSPGARDCPSRWPCCRLSAQAGAAAGLQRLLHVMKHSGSASGQQLF